MLVLISLIDQEPLLFWVLGFGLELYLLLGEIRGVFLCVPDECEEVEQQVQKVVQEMENILGEPLQSYF